MKKNQNTKNYSPFKNEKNTSFLRMSRRFYAPKDAFSFDVFSFLKAENEKLQIVFANIRV